MRNQPNNNIYLIYVFPFSKEEKKKRRKEKTPQDKQKGLKKLGKMDC